jgi:hypothetical protein
MPNFEIHYSFTCNECGKLNDVRFLKDAADKVQAYRSVKLDAVCKHCETPIDQEQHFTSTVKQLGES